MPLISQLKDQRAVMNINQADRTLSRSIQTNNKSDRVRGDSPSIIMLALKLAKIFNITVNELFALTDEENA